MKRSSILCGVVLMTGLLASGCQKAAPPADAKATPASTSHYVLATEPAGAQGVVEARKAFQDNQEAVAVGCIGGSEAPFVDGAAAFTIVDCQMKPCDDGCKTPWDYCCTPDLPSATATVKIVDAEGKPVMTDARKLLGVKESATVVVRGKAKRDEAGNLTLLADGIFVRP